MKNDRLSCNPDRNWLNGLHDIMNSAHALVVDMHKMKPMKQNFDEVIFGDNGQFYVFE